MGEVGALWPATSLIICFIHTTEFVRYCQAHGGARSLYTSYYLERLLPRDGAATQAFTPK